MRVLLVCLLGLISPSAVFAQEPRGKAEVPADPDRDHRLRRFPQGSPSSGTRLRSFWSAKGITAVEERMDKLDVCRKHGLKVRLAGTEAFPDLAKLKDDPAVLGYYLGDNSQPKHYVGFAQMLRKFEESDPEPSGALHSDVRLRQTAQLRGHRQADDDRQSSLSLVPSRGQALLLPEAIARSCAKIRQLANALSLLRRDARAASAVDVLCRGLRGDRFPFLDALACRLQEGKRSPAAGGRQTGAHDHRPGRSDLRRRARSEMDRAGHRETEKRSRVPHRTAASRAPKRRPRIVGCSRRAILAS